VIKLCFLVIEISITDDESLRWIIGMKQQDHVAEGGGWRRKQDRRDRVKATVYERMTGKALLIDTLSGGSVYPGYLSK